MGIKTVAIHSDVDANAVSIQVVHEVLVIEQHLQLFCSLFDYCCRRVGNSKASL